MEAVWAVVAARRWWSVRSSHKRDWNLFRFFPISNNTWKRTERRSQILFPAQGEIRKFPAIIGLLGTRRPRGHGRTRRASGGAGLCSFRVRIWTARPVAASKGAMVRHFPAWMKVLWDTCSFVQQHLPDVQWGKTAYFGFSLGASLPWGVPLSINAHHCGCGVLWRASKEMKFFMPASVRC